MATEFKSNHRRLAGSYLVSLISIVLVFYVLGVFAFFIMSSKELSDYLKENINIEVMVKSGTGEKQILQLKNKLEEQDYVRKVDYISQAEATKQLSEELGEDFLHWLGDEQNPLMPTLNVYIKADFANSINMANIQTELQNENIVKKVFYQKSIVELINKNIKKIGTLFLSISILLLLITIILIHNTIRLSIYSKRFLVRSMLLVGATPRFVRRPFVKSAVFQGFIGSLIAIGLLSMTLTGVNMRFPELLLLQDPTFIRYTYASLLVMGILLTALSAFVGVRKYLNTNIDKLYI